MLRVLLVSALLGVMALSGCGTLACSSMTDEEYTQIHDAVEFYATMIRLTGMSKSDFLDTVLPSDCTGTDEQQTQFGMMTCGCAVAIYTEVANEVW